MKVVKEILMEKLVRAGIVSLVLAAAGFAANPSDEFYSAIRSNDLARLEAMLKEGSSPNLADNRGITPLMYAATVGSADAMKLLIAKGADVNAKNAFGSTALMWSVTDLQKVRLLSDRGADVNAASKAGRTALLVAAMSDHSSDIVRLLIDKKADVKAIDAGKFTTLNAATLGNDTATIRLLIDAGVDVNAPGGPGLTPLMNAAGNGNLEAVKMLLAKGAKVNAVSFDTFENVKNGPIALGKFTPLLLAAASGSADVVKVLLNAGADVNAKDVRGMTPLMLALATDRPNQGSISALLAKGADVSTKSLAGETALDWALKSGDKPAADALKRAGAPASLAKKASVPSFAPVSLMPAVERSIALLEKVSDGFFISGGCSSCHHQNITDVAVNVARTRGARVNEAAAIERQKLNRARFGSAGPSLLERLDPPGTPDLPLYALAALASSGYAPDRMTDAMLANIVAQQWSDGSWQNHGVARPPVEDGDFFRTALGIRMIAVYAPPGRAVEMKDRIERAKAWLASAVPVTSEDRNMQLLGLHWAGADSAALQGLARKILVEQRADGGWSQRPELACDAYATGQTLYALAHTATLPMKDAAYQKAVKYLLDTQHADGSWYVASRSPKFQPYFESGFPYGHDQWISSMATGWAAAGLAYALEPASKAKTAE
jgi:ankyrin repeat protein